MNKYILKKIKLICKSPKFYILVLSFLPLLWFSKKGLINAGDLNYYLFDFHHIKQSFYLWNGLRDLGKSSIDILNIFPYFTLSIFLSKLNFSLGSIEKFFFIFWIFFSGLSMYYFTTKAFNANKMWAFFSAIFYMFNPYLSQYQWISFNKFFFFYAFAPLILMFYINGINNKYYFRNSVIFVFSLGLILSTVNITYFVVLGFLLFLVGAFYFIFNKKILRKDVIKFNFISVLLFLFIYLFAIVPVFNSYNNESTFDYFKSSISQGRTDLASLETSFINNFRLLGNWGYFLKSSGDYYYPYSSYYKTPLFVGLSFVFPLLVFLGIYILYKNKKIRKEERMLSVCLFFIMILGLFLVKGTHSPFAFINRSFYNNIPCFGMFRNQFVKLGILIVLPYSVFIGYAIHYVYQQLKSFNKFFGFSIVLITFVLMFPVFQFPYFTGEIYPKNYTTLKSPVIEIPDYLFDTLKWISLAKKDTKFAILPFKFGEKADMRLYDWGYSGTNLFFLNSEKPIFIGQIIKGEKEIEIIEKLKSKDYSFVDYLASINVGYLILENDRDDFKIYSNYISPKETKKELEKLSFINKIITFGKIDIYKISENFYIPHFYISDNIIIPDQQVDFVDQQVSLLNYKKKPTAYLDNKETKVNFEEIDKEIAKDTPILEFKKINPTKYKIIVHQAKDDFPLVFSESFHKGWKIYLAENEKLKIENIDLKKYKIFNENEDDQASKEELVDYISNGWVTDLGNGKEKEIKHQKWENNKERLDYIEKYSIDFISKNFQGTIQNDNLSNGYIWDTWFKEPMADGENHLMANGYANSWWVGLDEIKESGNYVQNPDGSIDFEVIVEFWPQRLFYLGMGISGLTLLGCFTYLIYDHRRRKKYKAIKIIHRITLPVRSSTTNSERRRDSVDLKNNEKN